MNVVDTAKTQVKQFAERITEKVTEKIADAAGTDSRIQALTISRPRTEVIALFRDPERLSQVFGDIARVNAAGADRMRWTFVLDGDGPAWDCVVSLDGENRLRYVDVNPDKPAEITLDFATAPQNRGTEVVARANAPLPGLLTGALIYKALYRARALLQTGEVPTIKRNPGARNSPR